jgi:hypothetical protein
MRKLISSSVVAAIVVSLLLAAPAAYASPPDSPPGGPIPEQAWTEGSPFPVVHGHTVFPPEPGPKLASSTGFQTHWYAGSVDPSSTQQDARSISTTITVPGSTPNSVDFYYVILSAFDSNGSYDQIGFSADYGTWGLSYSWTSNKGRHTTYHYSPNAKTLTPGTYTFTITTAGGVTDFAAYQGSTQVWSLNPAAPTGGNYLVLANSYSGYYDYTDYEEVWQTSTRGGAPGSDFTFSPNTWTGTDSSVNPPAWTIFTTAKTPGNVAVNINGGDVTVDNP